MTNNDLPHTTKKNKDWATQYSQTSSRTRILITFVLNLYMRFFLSFRNRSGRAHRRSVVIRGVEDGTYMKQIESEISSLLINSKSENTFNSNLLSFKRGDNFIKKKKTGFYALPAQSVHVALYITHLLDPGVSRYKVNSAV